MQLRSSQPYNKGITYDHQAKAGFTADHLHIQYDNKAGQSAAVKFKQKTSPVLVKAVVKRSNSHE